jgi:hypothetical protein
MHATSARSTISGATYCGARARREQCGDPQQVVGVDDRTRAVWQREQHEQSERRGREGRARVRAERAEQRRQHHSPLQRRGLRMGEIERGQPAETVRRHHQLRLELREARCAVEVRAGEDHQAATFDPSASSRRCSRYARVL